MAFSKSTRFVLNPQKRFIKDVSQINEAILQFLMPQLTFLLQQLPFVTVKRTCDWLLLTSVWATSNSTKMNKFCLSRNIFQPEFIFCKQLFKNLVCETQNTKFTVSKQTEWFPAEKKKWKLHASCIRVSELVKENKNQLLSISFQRKSQKPIKLRGVFISRRGIIVIVSENYINFCDYPQPSTSYCFKLYLILTRFAPMFNFIGQKTSSLRLRCLTWGNCLKIAPYMSVFPNFQCYLSEKMNQPLLFPFYKLTPLTRDLIQNWLKMFQTTFVPRTPI